MMKPEILEKHDLETHEVYFTACFNCETQTICYDDWAKACADAMDVGFRTIGGDVYCKDCIPEMLERIEEAEQDRKLLTHA